MKLSPLVICALAAPSLQAAIITDNFGTTPTDPNDLGWYSMADGSPTFTASTGALQFAASTTSNNPGIFKQFSETELAVGETLTASFTYTAFSSPRTTNGTKNQLRIGIFDTGDTFEANQALSPWSTTGGLPAGYQMGIGVGTETTGVSQFGYRAAQTGIVSFSTITPTNAFGLTNFTDAVDVVFSITRTATGISLNGSFTQSAVVNTYTTTVPATSVFKFDTLVIGYGFGETGRGFTIDNVSVAVVPEPSTYAALAGLLALGLVAMRRRRR